QECSSGNAHHFLAVHILFFNNAVLLANLLIDVAQQGVGQVVLVFELLLGLRWIRGDTEDNSPGILQFFVRFAEPASFYGSARCIGLRKEEQDYVLTAEILKRDVLPVLVGQSKLGSFIISIHGYSTSNMVIPQGRLGRHLPGHWAIVGYGAACAIRKKGDAEQRTTCVGTSRNVFQRPDPAAPDLHHDRWPILRCGYL